MALLKNFSFNPARGGHAPGDVRHAFGQAAEAWTFWDGKGDPPMVLLRDQMVPMGQLLGLLWNCTDIMPGMVCSCLEDITAKPVPQGSTYAKGARAFKPLVDSDPL